MAFDFREEIKKFYTRTRQEIVSSFYDKADEATRLHRTRHGQLEYFVTMHYIHQYTSASSKVLEVGAGTGTYSIALAKEGKVPERILIVDDTRINIAVKQEPFP